MKVTIEIPDALARDAQQVARRHGTTLRELVVAGLRMELEHRRGRTLRPDFHFPTVAGEGMVAGLGSTDALDRSYGLSR
ncbi:type II toxin-antitoxin system VapB family antitoxin [Ornithinimicrobium sp. F0845]|uniref:type II toxin-antitoxin system VapB family antitoxin n=1 Tax=Ornithinimicrobium sp. F0845 TaxID=2926412 RepID=UPI001FF2127E|nr:type II toxin-antitoxin system VapB family antitoxin [Ornithinimicrobium sp. F0845]MCK0112464.1 type II toxin-antitoxin system VapB family antitoxin [Ornithinimicrobium sp. F0845]